ncbi:hypothetical protein [Pseudalkalibacillus berkeleyi]|nr:hypothetical protein [Pseudalkalibacillus berkeleyi]
MEQRIQAIVTELYSLNGTLVVTNVILGIIAIFLAALLFILIKKK